jgi:SlyX protein
LSENLKRLEEKIAFLERHVTEQDKVMLELGDELARLRREVQSLRNRAPSGGSTAAPGDEAEERPPHY